MDMKKRIQEAFGEDWIDVPMNQCPINIAEVKISFKLNRQITYSSDDVMLHEIIDSIMGAINGMSQKNKEIWDYYHPELAIIPAKEKSDKTEVFIRFSVKEKYVHTKC